MNKIEINLFTGNIEIEFDTIFSTGIYIVDNPNKTKLNCEILEISVDFPKNELEVKSKITKIEDYGFYTIRTNNSFFQYIFSTDATEEGLKELLAVAPSFDHEGIKQAFSFSRPFNLGDLDSLMKSLLNK